MRRFRDRIPDEVLDEIFPEKLTRFQCPDKVHGQLKKMIFSGKLKNGQRVSPDDVVRNFNLSKWDVHKVISQLKKEGFIVCKGRLGSFIVRPSKKD